MPRAMRASWWLGALWFVVAGCGGGATSDVDASTPRDTGAERDGAAQDAGQDGGASEDASTPDDASTVIDASTIDASTGDASTIDASTGDAATATDAGTDAFVADDAATTTRRNILPGFCPSTPTAGGLYRGTLAGNTNDVVGACLVTAPGRDGSLRIRLDPGQTLRARYRHDGDGVLYLLDSCPVTSSCLVGANASFGGEESIEWTNGSSASNDVFLFLDSASLAAPQTFELDVEVTP